MNKIIKIIGVIVVTISLINCQEKSKKLNYQIYTSDIDNFWIAYDALENSKDSIQTIQNLYINKASPEFKKFIKIGNFKAKAYVNWIKDIPSFWKTVRPGTLAVKKKKPEIDKVYNNLQKIYDGFQAPDICFAISPLGSGGTTSKGLILIGTEIATVNSNYVDISEINGFFKNIFQNSSGDIVSMIAHELVHTQQPQGDNENASLLSQAIIEGAADFIGRKILGKPTMNKVIYNYGEEHQQALWKEFKQDINMNKGFDDTDWFYNYHSNRPADLGYYIGYKIVESYYNNSKDKKKAIKEILEMENPKEFLRKSRYNK